MSSKNSVSVTLVDNSTLTARENLPEWARQAGAEVKITSDHGELKVKISGAAAQTQRQAYAKGFGNQLKLILPDCSKTKPMEVTLELVEG